MKLSRKQILNSILAKAQEYKINKGDLEKKAGMTPGYLAKTFTEESKSNTLLDFIANVAEIFNVSIDALINVPLDKLTQNEKYFLDFLDKVLRDTDFGRIVWEKESAESFKDWTFRENHPLFTHVGSYDNSDYIYNSLFYDNVEVMGDCYKVDIENNKLYFMCVGSENEFLFYEFYFLTAEGIVKVCNICISSPLWKFVEILYKAAAESSKHIKIEKSLKNIIDNYLAIGVTKTPDEITDDEYDSLREIARRVYNHLRDDSCPKEPRDFKVESKLIDEYTTLDVSDSLKIKLTEDRFVKICMDYLGY